MIDLMCGNGYDINWNAWAAIGTMLAVFTAIGLHIAAEQSRDTDSKAATENALAQQAVRAKHLCIMIAPLLNDIKGQIEALPTRLKQRVSSGQRQDDPSRELTIWGVDELDDVLKDASSLPQELSEPIFHLIAWSKLINVNIQRNTVHFSLHTAGVTADLWALHPTIVEDIYLQVIANIAKHCDYALDGANRLAYPDAN